MDLGCVDMGCIEKQSNEISPQKESSSSSSSSSDSVMATSKIGKNKPIKESGQSNWNAFSKCSSQIRKPPRRKTSPLNWFPRKKVDSYLMRKIKLLQEVDGMNSTLDETLGDSNLHYSRVLKEKIAVKEAATKAMEARKAAMVEASWCRILKAASIECKDAEAQLVDAENVAAEAFEAATAIGVTMYDIPDCPQRHCKIESSAVKGGGSATTPTHTVSASFETAFEVDKQVANALKTALTNLANCSSIKEEDFRELLRKISQNPDSDENSQDFSEISSECESDTGSEFEMALHGNGYGSQSCCCTHEKESSGVRHRKKRQVSEKFNMANLAEMMLERLKSLQEDQLASLAIVVATCGLSAALAEAESSKKHDLSCTTNNQLHIPAPRRMSFSEVRNFGMDRQKMKIMAETELPSLDKFLVKKLTRLEREVLEAKNARKNEVREGNMQQPKKSGEMDKEDSNSLDESVSEFGNGLVKHSSKLEKEIEEARKNGMFSTARSNKLDRMRNLGGSCGNQDVAELPSLDKFLVKHVSRLEKEVQEAKNRRNFEPLDDGRKFSDSRKATCFTPEAASTEKCSSFAERESPVGKENINLNKNIELDFDPNKRKPSLKTAEELSHENDGSKDAGNCHDKVLVNADHVCQGDAMQESSLSNTRKQHMRNGGNGNTDCESLDKILVKHVSRLEREKMEFCAREGAVTNLRRETKKELELDKWGGAEESLDQVLVKHKSSKLEREKMSAAAAAQPLEEDQVMHSVARRAARQKELQEAWGGMSLGNSMRPHLSRLQRDKAAWVKAEEEEKGKKSNGGISCEPPPHP